MNNTFITKLDHMTCKHCIEQPMPMVERLINRKVYKKYELIKTPNDIVLTLHMGHCESEKRDVYYTSGEDEYLRLVFARFFPKEMETVKDVLCFLNELDFVDELDNNYLEKIDEIKGMVVREIKDYNISNIIYALNLIDEIKLSGV